MKLTKDQISAHINEVLSRLFEVDEDQLIPKARLYEDLDIDSIDTIDLLIELKRIIGQDIDPQAFREARTLEDVTNIIVSL
jgi:acyl carrier protein